MNQSSGQELSYSWDFGDGTGKSELFQPSYNYRSEGSYGIKLLVKDRYGCIDSVTKTDYIKILNPKAAFHTNDTVATCPPLVTAFLNQSKNYNAYLWDFGDGTLSTIDNPTHFYTFPGTYNSRLIVTSPGGVKIPLQRRLLSGGRKEAFLTIRLKAAIL